jgi:SnoaL-like domain
MTGMETRLALLEAEAELRRLAARYMRLCDEPEPAEAGPGFAELFSDDVIWEGIGAKASQEFSRVEGRAALLAWFATMRVPGQHMHAFNIHFLTSEEIIVDNQHATAEGRWTMFQTMLRAGGTAELRMARIIITFKREHDRWLIAHFTTRSLLKTVLDERTALAISGGIA